MTADSLETPLSPIFSHHIFARERVGGISRYFVELNNALRRAEVPTRILAPLYFAEDLGGVPGMVGVRIPPLPATRSAARLLCTTLEPLAIRYFRRRIGDGLVVHRTYHSRSPVPSGVAHVETVHDMIHERFPEYFPHDARTTEAKRVACEQADMIIAVSEHTKRMATESFGLPPDRIRVCYHGVSTFTVDEKRRAELEASPPFLLVVGNRSGYKNFTRLLEAFAGSEAAKEGITLRAFGGGAPTRAELEQIESLRLNKLVEFDAGNDGALAAHYKSAIALVYPGLEEGFGMPPLEAMAQGLPVIASDAGGIPEVVGDAAILCDPFVVESITAAIDKLLLDDVLRRQLSLLGVERAAQFTWERTANTTSAIYAAAVDNARERI